MQNSKPRIDKMVIVYSARPLREPPREGDRRMIKGVMHVRRRVMIRPYGPGSERMAQVHRGKPVFEWVTEEKYKAGYT